MKKQVQDESKKTFIVTKETHDMIKDYCAKMGYKMNTWVERKLIAIMKDEEAK